MSDCVIRPKNNLQLRKLGNSYMIVEVSAENVNMSNVYTLNKTAADMWQLICDGERTAADLAGWLCSKYDVESATAQADVEQQLAEWREFGLIF